MLEILQTLRDTPLPIILVVGGLVFLLVPFIRRVSDKVEVETTNKGFAGFIGFVLLTIGIGLYIIPTQESISGSPTTIPSAISAPETQKVDTAQSTTTSTQNSLPSPLIPHNTESIGTGVFSQATYSTGYAPVSQEDLNSSHFKIQSINLDTASNGCGTSWYSVYEIWFGGSSKTTLYLNGTAVGELFLGNGKQGHMIPLSVSAGDELCVKPIPPGGFHVNLGADIYYHYDSFCYRGNC